MKMNKKILVLIFILFINYSSLKKEKEYKLSIISHISTSLLYNKTILNLYILENKSYNFFDVSAQKNNEFINVSSYEEEKKDINNITYNIYNQYFFTSNKKNETKTSTNLIVYLSIVIMMIIFIIMCYCTINKNNNFSIQNKKENKNNNSNIRNICKIYGEKNEIRLRNQKKCIEELNKLKEKLKEIEN